MLGKYSFGTGDRFGQQGKAQLKAIKKAKKNHDLEITPVWNKSHREHEIIGTSPMDVRQEADDAVEALDWKYPYCVDADHITKDIVDVYISCSNFFTLDIADYIGNTPSAAEKKDFLERNRELLGSVSIPGIEDEFDVTEQYLSDWADQYLAAINQANEIFEHIRRRKEGQAVFEMSMDEVEDPQSPLELFFILKTASEQGLTIDTIAPKFTGDFYKGIDYVGNIDQFVKEFEQDLKVIAHAVDTFALPANLKLSVHSGSDKFSLYPQIRHLLKKHDAGIHLKTSGTTWLEELIGLADASNEGWAMVQKIYRDAYGRYEELTQPYAPVVDVQEEQLPLPKVVDSWSAKKFVGKLEHDQSNPDFDPQLRQFLHCSYKIAAEQGTSFIALLKRHEKIIGERVTHNLYARHIAPLFLV
ncbi:tagaturonate epimerase family protein [Fodinibius salsisoli]|uniref:Tagaturonate/fructuronate epimerase n=1 Tax=Fodinibius salsisoli TaxID=2820877 RepID=A0ABT3PL21_9BACT|nr:tagaturonate epimerase family protein [Fodinibius salsisoli]MCW9706604.1 hypothetical protein [Fodinibius salsisoli]